MDLSLLDIMLKTVVEDYANRMSVIKLDRKEVEELVM